MPDLLAGFEKKKDFLICIDSDGCAMDTMDCKHITCFGPCLIPVWELEPWRDQVLKRWNEINLYTMTRGINRFKGLAMILAEIDRQYRPIPGAACFGKWVSQAPELSNASVKKQWEDTGEPVFLQAVQWSEEVNRRICRIPARERKAFPGVREAVEKAHAFADVAIVSSANCQAVVEEWRSQGLLEFADIVMSQDNGTKSDCIRTLLEKGYDRQRVLMAGDAPGDCQAASENGVCFYPILVRKEEASWKDFLEKGLDRFLRGDYAGAFQMRMREAFEDNLKG